MSSSRKIGPWKRLRREAASILIEACIRMLHAGPVALTRALGWLGGRWAALFAFKSKRRALEHLTLALGSERSPRELRRIRAKVFHHFGRVGTDLLAVHRGGAARLEDRVEGGEHFRALLEEGRRRGRGVVAVCAHLGNWELMAAYTALSAPVAVVARRMHDPRVDRRVVAFRARNGVRTLYQHESPRRLLEWLKGNGVLGIVADQDVSRLSGVFVPFFGRPAYTPTAPASLSIRTGAPILPAVLVYTKRGFRILASDRLLEPETTGHRQRDLEAHTARWNAWIERFVREYPEQWGWWHRRWKTQPDRTFKRTGEADVRDLVAKEDR